MKFKVLKEFVLNGIVQKLDSIIELDYVKAHLKSIQANIEKVPENTLVSGAKEGSVLSTLKPGEQLTPEQKKKLAVENAAETAEAHRLAAEHRAHDMQEGKGETPIKVIAESLKDKLEREDFTATPAVEPPTPPTTA